MPDPRTGIEKIVAIYGTQRAAARALSTPDRPVSYQLLQWWLKRGYVPAQWCLQVHAASGVPLHELNPSVYPAPAPPPSPETQAAA